MKKLLFLFLLPIGLLGQFNLLNASKDEVEENLLQFDGQFSEKTITNSLNERAEIYKSINNSREEIHNKYILNKLKLKIINGGFDGKGSIIVGRLTETFAAKTESLGYRVSPFVGNPFRSFYLFNPNLLNQGDHNNPRETKIIMFGRQEGHNIWENSLGNFGVDIGYLPLKNNFEKSLLSLKGVFDHSANIYGVPFAVYENGLLKQLREINADYIVEISDYFNGIIYRAKDFAVVAEFSSGLRSLFPPTNVRYEGVKKSRKQKKQEYESSNDKISSIRSKRYGDLKKLWDKPKIVEGIKLTRDDFISVIFDELIKSSEKIYEDISKFKSDDYIGMPLNEFSDLCDRAVYITSVIKVPNLDEIDAKTFEKNEKFDYSRFSYKIEQYDIDGKVIDRLLISLARFAKTMEDGSFYSYNGISSIERDPIFEKN